MANTYTRIYLHIVFAVKNREALIPPQHENSVHSYMAAIINNNGHYANIVGGTANHVHILMDYNPNQKLPDLIRDLKACTTNYINNTLDLPFKFAWQRGYGAFSYSPTQVPQVKNYILRQHEHHDHDNGETLRDEMKRILEAYGLDYDPVYIFEDV